MTTWKQTEKEFDRIFKGTVLWKEHKSFLRTTLTKVLNEVVMNEFRNHIISDDQEGYNPGSSRLVSQARHGHWTVLYEFGLV